MAQIARGLIFQSYHSLYFQMEIVYTKFTTICTRIQYAHCIVYKVFQG